MLIGLIPLDERPVNTRYPQAVAEIAGTQVLLPPESALSQFRTPAQSQALVYWLQETAPRLDTLVASFEMLGYGGLIASRTTHDSTAAVLTRLEALSKLRARCPSLPVYGFSLVTRLSNADSAVEEPLYWAQEGRRFYRYAQLLDMRETGQYVEPELGALQAALPQEHRDDFLHRRLRNHTVNLSALHMLGEGALDLLVLSSDDTSPFGLPSSEKRALERWANRLALDERLLLYPGADEVGTALTARALNQATSSQPRFAVGYAVPGGEAVTAPYEDGPVAVTVERQVRAVGGQVVSPEQPADFWLAVNPPVPRRSEWHPDFAAAERRDRLPYLTKLADEINHRMAEGQPVIVADVAYPNGADPTLIEVLFEKVAVANLAAYGAWNTAGNTIGVALAQGCARRLANTPEGLAAQQRFLLHRFLEDWGYQQVVRRQTRAWLQAETGLGEVRPENEAAALAHIATGLAHCLKEIPGFDGLEVRPGSLRLPWHRLFEVDFEIAATAT